MKFKGLFGNSREKLKSAICRRTFQAGDVVQVANATWPTMNHPRGGMGHWAIYVSRGDGGYRVRPLDSWEPQPVVEVPIIEHLDDIEARLAMAAYRARRFT
jgi:hypothetical protein